MKSDDVDSGCWESVVVKTCPDDAAEGKGAEFPDEAQVQSAYKGYSIIKEEADIQHVGKYVSRGYTQREGNFIKVFRLVTPCLCAKFLWE